MRQVHRRAYTAHGTYFDQTFRIESGVEKQQVVAHALGVGVGLAERFAREQQDLAVRPELVVPQTVAQPLQSAQQSVRVNRRNGEAHLYTYVDVMIMFYDDK